MVSMILYNLLNFYIQNNIKLKLRLYIYNEN